MNNSSIERFYLINCFGKVVDYDAGRDQLCVRSITDIKPVCSVKIENGRSVFQVSIAHDKQDLSVCSDGHMRIAYHSVGEICFERVSPAYQYVMFRHGRMYLSASPEGVVTFCRVVGIEWEKFRLVTEEEYEILSYLLNERWYFSSCNKVMSFSKDDYDLFKFNIGSFWFGVEDILQSFGGVKKKDVIIPHKVWQLEKLTLYKPLIYYCAFGNDSGFKALEMSVQSLSERGRYHDDIFIMSDRNYDDTARRFQGLKGRNIRFLSFLSFDMVDYMSARFDASYYPEFSDYQPVLYLDTDTIVHAPLEGMFCQVLEDQKTNIHVSKETSHPCSEGYWGRDLFRDDVSDFHPEYGFTTGVMVYRNIDCVRDTMLLVRETIRRQAKVLGTSDVLRCFDQPVANYVMHKVDNLDDSILGGASENFDMAFNHANDTDYLKYASGLQTSILHFAGGVGAYEWKVGAMQRFLDVMKEREHEFKA